MKEFNIVGDIAGNFETLLALQEKMPKARLISVGDMIDRGPRSRDVLDFFKNGGGEALMGNHEHMMLDWLARGKIYQQDIWFSNGGNMTVASFFPGDFQVPMKEVREKLGAYFEWMSALPLAIRTTSKLFVSHAPYGRDIKDPVSALWNRAEAQKSEGYFSVHGHNPLKEVKWYTEGEEKWGANIDTSLSGKLTGIHFPSLELFSQEIIDKPLTEEE